MDTDTADLRDPNKLLRQLDLAAIDRRLIELESERRALMALARAARARQTEQTDDAMVAEARAAVAARLAGQEQRSQPRRRGGAQ